MTERRLAGREPITERQLEVARLVAAGYTNERIARELGISHDGAKYHVSELLGRLGFSRREEIAAWYRTEMRVPLHRRLRGLLGVPLLLGAAGLGTVAGVIAIAIVFSNALNEPSAEPTPPPDHTVAATPTSAGVTPDAPPGFYPPGTRTGVPEVDRVIEAIERGDGVDDLVGTTPVECVAPDARSIGLLVCPEGALPGDEFEVFSWGSCEPQLTLNPSEAVARLGLTESEFEPFLHSVSERTLDDEFEWEIVFGRLTGDAPLALQLVVNQEGAVIGAFQCAFPTLGQDGVGWLLPPLP